MQTLDRDVMGDAMRAARKAANRHPLDNPRDKGWYARLRPARLARLEAIAAPWRKVDLPPGWVSPAYALDLLRANPDATPEGLAEIAGASPSSIQRLLGGYHYQPIRAAKATRHAAGQDAAARAEHPNAVTLDDVLDAEGELVEYAINEMGLDPDDPATQPTYQMIGARLGISAATVGRLKRQEVTGPVIARAPRWDCGKGARFDRDRDAAHAAARLANLPPSKRCIPPSERHRRHLTPDERRAVTLKRGFGNGRHERTESGVPLVPTLPRSPLLMGIVDLQDGDKLAIRGEGHGAPSRNPYTRAALRWLQGLAGIDATNEGDKLILQRVGIDDGYEPDPRYHGGIPWDGPDSTRAIAGLLPGDSLLFQRDRDPDDPRRPARRQPAEASARAQTAGGKVYRTRHMDGGVRVYRVK